jgi:NAD(P)-dependent dehydrogenase (short-subunit alcohol dehydrogenase family)
MSQWDGVTLLQCDVTKNADVKRLADFVRNNSITWKTLFSSVGSSEPIGRFFDLDFDVWESSIQINCIGQLRALHALYPFRAVDSISNVALLAGGGTNNPFRCYSAYCVSKILLIKMTELLDDEADDLNAFIVGPGFVRTKTHLETINAGTKVEDNVERIRAFWESDDPGTPMEDIYDCIRWLEEQGRDVAGGRNFSVVHDQWGSDMLAEALLGDREMYKLRRSGNRVEIADQMENEELK